MTAEQIVLALSRLRLMREAITHTPHLSPDGSLVPLLTASAECAALTTAIRVLETQLKGAVS